jgi:formylglycine-generating enzyme required for sulfatase activity
VDAADADGAGREDAGSDGNALDWTIEFVGSDCDGDCGEAVHGTDVEGVDLGDDGTALDGVDLPDGQEDVEVVPKCLNDIDCPGVPPCKLGRCDPLVGCTYEYPDIECGDIQLPCRTGRCQFGSCQTQVLPDSTTCDDGDPCTLVDLCLEGACVGGLLDPECSPICGDGYCGGPETTCNCPGDCGLPCADKQCGPDGCGSSCGNCSPYYDCVDGICVYVPYCGDHNCDVDEDCGNCLQDCPCGCGEVCHSGVCEFVGCDGKECGDGECGVSCGTCPFGSYCLYGHTCGAVPGLDWVQIPGGTFDMGCSDGGLADCWPDEKPVHPVTLLPFQMMVAEMTEGQYFALMGTNPSCHYNGSNGDDHPVECVSWLESKAVCTVLNGRLPSEAEWEYAARGGTTTRHYCGNTEACLLDIAWYWANSSTGTGPRKHPIRLKLPNAWGLYDMLGNIYEWTNDWYSNGYYSEWFTDNPKGPNEGSTKVVRGGYFGYSFEEMRLSNRYSFLPGAKVHFLGLRCVR